MLDTNIKLTISRTKSKQIKSLTDHEMQKAVVNKRQKIPHGGNQKLTIQRNWKHSVHKTKTNKTKTQRNTFWTPLYENKHK